MRYLNGTPGFTILFSKETGCSKKKDISRTVRVLVHLFIFRQNEPEWNWGYHWLDYGSSEGIYLWNQSNNKPQWPFRHSRVSARYCLDQGSTNIEFRLLLLNPSLLSWFSRLGRNLQNTKCPQGLSLFWRQFNVPNSRPSQYFTCKRAASRISKTSNCMLEPIYEQDIQGLVSILMLF